MKHRVPLLVLGVFGIAPVAVTAACGGKIAGADAVNEGSASPSAPGPGGTGASSTATGAPAGQSSSRALQPCAADSTPLPMPKSPDPVVLAQCKTFCERSFTCLGCSYASCLPTCMSDALATRASGAPYVAWMSCLLAHEPTCGVEHACDAEYCTYLRSDSSPSAPFPPECQ